MHYRELKSRVRELGYQLAVREIYGENSQNYYNKKREHYLLLNKLYKQEQKCNSYWLTTQDQMSNLSNALLLQSFTSWMAKI